MVDHGRRAARTVLRPVVARARARHARPDAGSACTPGTCDRRVSSKGGENLPDRHVAGCCVPGRVQVGVLGAESRRGHPDRSPVWRRRPGAGVAAAVAGDRDTDGPGVHRDVAVGASGTYSVTVPAGRYTLAGHSPLYGSGT